MTIAVLRESLIIDKSVFIPYGEFVLLESRRKIELDTDLVYANEISIQHMAFRDFVLDKRYETIR